MHYYEVAPRKIIRADAETFTFQSDEKLLPGAVVLVSIGKSNVIGVVMQSVAKPSYATKPVVSVISSHPLPEALLASARWLGDYYQTPLGVVLQTILPAGLTKTRRSKYISPATPVRKRTNIVLNTDQQAALQKIQRQPSGTFLLHGVTGSGKTVIYIEAAKQAIAEGKSVIILVPEISLTSQLVSEFSSYFSNIILTHSRQTEAERHLTWLEALQSAEPRVVIGPRSALFMPLTNIGLIVVDEFHEPSFKQEQAPRYSATQLASILASEHQARLLLGSATPSVADYYLAQHNKRPVINLPQPALASARPETSLIDMTKRQNFTQHRFLSDGLLKSIDESLANNQQVLIFHNRRGSTSSSLCEECGWQATCPHCFLPLVLHADHFRLRCHVCNYEEFVPTSCPECGGADIIHKGIGTKLIESELKHLFPKVSIARFDGDNSRHDSLDQRYQEVYDGKISIIIGTQTIAKGLDLPHLGLVGVVQADAGLSLPDFTASERTFQLLAQVVGRVGRTDQATKVLVQTYQPAHPVIEAGIQQDYPTFYKHTLKERQRASFPPYTYLLKITCVYKTEAAAIRNIKQLATTIRSTDPSLQLFGPAPAFYERIRDTYRWQLVVKSPKRSRLLDAVRLIPTRNFTHELDPPGLL